MGIRYTSGWIFAWIVWFAMPNLNAQEIEPIAKLNKHRLLGGIGLNIPFEPTSNSYDLGFGVFQQYEFLLGDHFSLIQSLGFNYLEGRSVYEFYQNDYIEVDYENFYAVPLQIGIGFYFGEFQQKFFIHFTGGISYYRQVNPAYPAIIVNESVVREAIPRTVEDGVFHFFTPEIGWTFRRIQLSFMYQTHIQQDANVGIARLGLAYNFFKP
jgi:hypothetical protein